jgi:hypothetical protein
MIVGASIASTTASDPSLIGLSSKFNYVPEGTF